MTDKAEDAVDMAKVANGVNKSSPYSLIPTHTPTLNKKQYADLMEDISNNGIKESIKYVEHNGHKYVVDGHHRLNAAKELNIANVPIEKVDLPYKGYKSIDDFFWGN